MTALSRRLFLATGMAALASPAFGQSDVDGMEVELFDHPGITPWGEAQIDFASLTRPQWRERLNAEQFRVLREEGTERPGTSPLNDEHRDGLFVCAGCALPLFSSEAKYESGTGWPSFWTPIRGALGTKTDYRIWTPRTEYHCARCGGHQGHVFDDGPRPTRQRWCNNGVALTFIPRPDTM